ncbi:hypothetical protein TIFTF001_020585 [Ficus carica]|uniref:Uncharacterized protein n=1 Tax=Ficus carica TaxID=3494 RepID=A0AA88DDT1_FICCA|nr:hypothetical protein TIFTF001_020585 [Ficus carica]
MTVSPPSHCRHRHRPLPPATTPPNPLSPSLADAAAAFPSLSFSRQCCPILPTRPSPFPLSPSPVAAAFSSQQGCLEKRRDSFASKKSKVTLLLNFLFS